MITTVAILYQRVKLFPRAGFPDVNEIAELCGNPLSTSQVISTIVEASMGVVVWNVAILYQRVKLFPQCIMRISGYRRNEYVAILYQRVKLFPPSKNYAGGLCSLFGGNPLSTSQVISTILRRG